MAVGLNDIPADPNSGDETLRKALILRTNFPLSGEDGDFTSKGDPPDNTTGKWFLECGLVHNT